jgi:hypothetical protein
MRRRAGSTQADSGFIRPPEYRLPEQSPHTMTPPNDDAQMIARGSQVTATADRRATRTLETG